MTSRTHFRFLSDGETAWSQVWEWSVVDQTNFVVRHQKGTVALGSRKRCELRLVTLVVDGLCGAERSGNQGALLILPAFVRLFQVFVEPLDVFRDVSHVPLLPDALDKNIILTGHFGDLPIDYIF